MQVSDLMHRRIVTIAPEASAAEAARVMTQHDAGMLPVCTADGKVEGVLTDRDIVTRCVAARLDPRQATVRELMTRGVVGVEPHEDVRTATDLLAGEQVRRLPVLEHGKLVGMLTLADLAHHALYDMEAARALTEITDVSREY